MLTIKNLCRVGKTCNKRYLVFVLIVWAIQATAQSKTDSFLAQMLLQNRHPIVQEVLNHPSKYRCQIIYTQIKRNKQNKRVFNNYFFNYNPHLYFNPASTVKMPLAFLSVEKLEKLQNKQINLFTPIHFDSSYSKQKVLHTDTTALNQQPSIGHFIKRAFLISENDPYNRMYQWMGQKAINETLHQKGYNDVRITRQFMGFSDDENRHTNAINFIDQKGNIIYHQAPQYNTDSFHFGNDVLIGKSYLNRNDSLINEPFNFTRHNNIGLLSLQQMLQTLIDPSSVPYKQRWAISEKSRSFLLQFLSQYPSETDDPKYDSHIFYDSYVKFFFRDSTHLMPKHIRVFNKVGWAYGFLTDVSYVMDTLNNVEYMLAATLYVNSDEIVNDSQYDYDTVGHPFLSQIGATIYQYELTRKRTQQPKLHFPVNYPTRNKLDTRKPISIVDN